MSTRRPWSPPDAPGSSAGAGERTCAVVIAVMATLWMFAVSCWGIAGTFPDGHFAATASIGTAGRNMWLFKTAYPVLRNVETLSGSPYYMHHPLGVFWVEALLVKALGEHNWVLRLPAVVYSTLSPIVIYRIGQTTWGALAGALSAMAYVSLPITLGFANFHALEGPVIAGCLLATWGYARFVVTARERYLVASLLGFAWAVLHDWAGYLWGAAFLGWLFVRGFVLPPNLFGPLPLRPLARYWGLMCAVALLSLGLIGALVLTSGKLSELLGMYAARSAGSSAPLSEVLQSRRVWIGLMFPGLAVALGKLAAAVLLARVIVRRSELDALPLCFLAMASIQYLHFKQGADVHIFWSHYFAPCFALGVGALIASVRELIVWAGRRWSEYRWASVAVRRAPWLAAGLLALPLLSVLKDGVATLRLGRETGGRYNSPMIQSDVDKVAALRWFLARARPEDKLAFHEAMGHVSWSLDWELRGHVLVPGQPFGDRAETAARFFVLDSRLATPSALKEAATSFQVHAVDGYWLIDRAAPAGPIDGYTFDQREPTWWQWYLFGGTEPVRRVVSDPWVTWEWRELLEQPRSPPPGNPATPEQLRIAHNAAVASGDPTRAQVLRERLLATMTSRVSATYDNGVQLLAVRHHRGAERRLTCYFVGGRFAGRATFAVTATIEAGPRLSTLPLDGVDIAIAAPPPIPTTWWRPGHLYANSVVYRKRPGTESYRGQFASLDGNVVPVRTDAAGPVTLARVSDGL